MGDVIVITNANASQFSCEDDRSCTSQPPATRYHRSRNWVEKRFDDIVMVGKRMGKVRLLEMQRLYEWENDDVCLRFPSVLQIGAFSKEEEGIKTWCLIGRWFHRPAVHPLLISHLSERFLLKGYRTTIAFPWWWARIFAGALSTQVLCNGYLLAWLHPKVSGSLHTRRIRWVEIQWIKVFCPRWVFWCVFITAISLQIDDTVWTIGEFFDVL